MLKIRSAVLQDLNAITEIYNQAVRNSIATFDINPKTLEEQKVWFSHFGPEYPILVAQQDDLIVGWACLSRWSDRSAYSSTAEISLYIRENYQGRGIGKKLSAAIIQAGEDAGLHAIIARIAEGNAISVHIAESFGFEHIGIMKEVGRKFDKFLDVYLMQKIYDSPAG
jgi:L-amino acid N-acyltransferase YncA